MSPSCSASRCCRNASYPTAGAPELAAESTWPDTVIYTGGVSISINVIFAKARPCPAGFWLGFTGQALNAKNIGMVIVIMQTNLTIVQGAVRPPGSLSYGWSSTPVGEALLAWNEQGLRYLSLSAEDKKASLNTLACEWPTVALSANSSTAPGLLHELIRGESPMPVVLEGTAFQCAVWRALTNLALGEVISYGELARRLGRPSAARAVGSAVAGNRIAILVPCHRVVQATGAIGQFRWGAATKSALLAWEQNRAYERFCSISLN